MVVAVDLVRLGVAFSVAVTSNLLALRGSLVDLSDTVARQSQVVDNGVVVVATVLALRVMRSCTVPEQVAGSAAKTPLTVPLMRTLYGVFRDLERMIFAEVTPTLAVARVWTSVSTAGCGVGTGLSA